jgi:hypothetical protein
MGPMIAKAMRPPANSRSPPALLIPEPDSAKIANTMNQADTTALRVPPVSGAADERL